MGLSNQAKAIITMGAASDVLVGNPFIDYLVCVSPSGVAGDQAVLQDQDGDPVALFPINGSSYEGLRWINQRIRDLTLVTNTANRATIYVHLRV